MAVIHADADYVTAPKNYADLFQLYYPYVCNLCARWGIDENNVEDVASEILLRFMERGSLEKFNPDLAFEYQGEMRPARFRSYLSRAVELYSRGFRDRQRKLAVRELQICDVDYTPSGRSGRPMPGALPWVEQFGDVQEDHADGVHDMFDDEAEADGVRAFLARVPPRSSHDTCDLVALYDAARTQILAFGEYDINILKNKFGVSSTAMHTWMWWLKQNLAHIYGVPVPAKRPRRRRIALDDGCLQ